MKYQTTIPNSPTGNDDVSIAKSPPIILDMVNNKNPLLRQFKSMTDGYNIDYSKNSTYYG